MRDTESACRLAIRRGGSAGDAAGNTRPFHAGAAGVGFRAAGTQAERHHAGPYRDVHVLLGVDDFCLIETDDATLLILCERCQDVRLLVDWLKANRPEFL